MRHAAENNPARRGIPGPSVRRMEAGVRNQHTFQSNQAGPPANAADRICHQPAAGAKILPGASALLRSCAAGSAD